MGSEMCIRDRMKQKIHPAWIVAGITFGTLFATAGFRSAPSVLILPLEEEFGWRRDVISAAIAINVLLYGLTAPFAAALMDRFTVRKVVMGALTVIGIGAFLTIWMSQSWHLMLLWGVVVGVGTGSMALVFAALPFCNTGGCQSSAAPYGLELTLCGSSFKKK